MLRTQFVLAIIFYSGVAHAAEFTSTPAKDGSTIAVLTGEIATGDKGKLKDLIRSANERSGSVSAIRLNSPGGNLVEGVELAEVVQFGRLATSVVAGAKCASACFIAFAAGNEKFANYGSWIGVHGASDKVGRDTTQSKAATVVMARLVKELGVPAAIIGKMVVTPPDEMLWLTANDLRSMGVTMTGKPTQVRPDGPEVTTGSSAPSSKSAQANKESGPMALIPSIATRTDTNSPPTWQSFTDTAIKLSAAQNGGKARTGRLCQPEFRQCVTGVYFKVKDGTEFLARVTEDLSGHIVKRDVCSFNRFMDVRTCMNWDTEAITRSMKNPKVSGSALIEANKGRGR